MRSPTLPTPEQAATIARGVRRQAARARKAGHQEFADYYTQLAAYLELGVPILKEAERIEALQPTTDLAETIARTLKEVGDLLAEEQKP